VRRSRAVVVLALALLGGLLAVGVWLRAPRPPAAPVVAEDGAAASSPATATSRPAESRPAASRSPPQLPRTLSSDPAAPAPDERLLAGIRAQVRTDPRQAEALAREARARFPDSPRADEWDALLVDALVNQQRIGAARSETYYYYDHHPGGAFAAHLFALTGVHPVPVGPGPH